MTGPNPPATPPPRRAWVWRRLRAEQARSADLLRRAQWLQAELENVRKQAARERGEARQRAAEALAVQLLPVLDALEAAGPDPGLALVRRDLLRTLEAEGLRPIPALDQPFDPALHEAAQRAQRPCQPGEAPGLRVAREVRRGYTLHGRVLRPALVHVLDLLPQEPAAPAAEPGA